MTTQYCTQCGAMLVSRARFCRECGAPVQPAKAKKRTPRRGKGKAVPIPLILLAASAILLLALGLYSLLNRPVSLPEIPDDHDASGFPYPEVARVSLAQTKAGSEKGTSLIVDVRTREEYEEVHIPGAMSMPLVELESRYRELPKDAEIITYCS